MVVAKLQRGHSVLLLLLRLLLLLLLLLSQINHLGPYTLTRLLEAKLAASAARVVFVSSIVHRFAAIR
jgi:hypothetical protein